MWAWVSTNPGTIVLPEASIVRAPSGTASEPVGPRAAIRLSRTRISPFSTTSRPAIVTIRAPLSSTTPWGMSRSAWISISASAGRYAGSSSSPSPETSAVAASAAALAASAASAASQVVGEERPTQRPVHGAPAAAQAGNSPPTSVSRRTGTVALSGSPTLIAGASPPTPRHHRRRVDVALHQRHQQVPSRRHAEQGRSDAGLRFRGRGAPHLGVLPLVGAVPAEGNQQIGRPLEEDPLAVGAVRSRGGPQSGEVRTAPPVRRSDRRGWAVAGRRSPAKRSRSAPALPNRSRPPTPGSRSRTP